MDHGAVDIAGPVHRNLIRQHRHHRLVQVREGLVGPGERDLRQTTGREPQRGQSGRIQPTRELLELLGPLRPRVIAALVDRQQRVHVEQVGDRLILRKLLQQPAGAVEPDPGDRQVAAVEPLQRDLDRLHRRVLLVALGKQSIESLLAELNRLPSVPQPPRRHAVGRQVVSVQFGGVVRPSETVVRRPPVTAAVRGSRGKDFVVSGHGNAAHGIGPDCRTWVISRRPTC